jgi:hypothetical protein
MTVFLDKNIYAPAGGYLAEHTEVVTDFEHPENLLRSSAVPGQSPVSSSSGAPT